MLISGSFVVQFFDDMLWEESDLDIYLQEGPRVRDFCGYLTRKEEYVLVEEKPAENSLYPSDDILRVSRYEFLK